MHKLCSIIHPILIFRILLLLDVCVTTRYFRKLFLDASKMWKSTILFSRLLKFLTHGLIFGQNSNFWSKLESLVQTRIFGQKSNFWSKLESLVKPRIFGQNSNFWSKLESLVKTRIFGQNSNLWSKLEFLVKTRIFGQNSEFWTKRRRIEIFDHKFKCFDITKNFNAAAAEKSFRRPVAFQKSDFYINNADLLKRTRKPEFVPRGVH